VSGGKTTRDLLIGFGSQLVFKALGFVVLALMARRLSQADYGKLMFALTLCGVTVLITDLGASSDLVRRVAASPGGARRRIEAVLSGRLPLLLAYFVLLCVWVALTKPDVLGVAAAIAVYSVLKDVYRTHSSLFLGLHRIEYTVAAYGSKLLFLVAAVATGAATGAGLAWMAGAHVASGALLLGVAAGITRAKVGRIRLRCGFRLMKRVFGGSIWLFAASVMGLVHFGADTLMLGYMKPYDQVAVYEAAAKLLEAAQFLVRPLALVLFPVCTLLASRRQWDELRRLMHKMFAGMAGVGLVSCVFVAVLALPIVRIVYTETYDDSAMVLRVLYLSLPGLYVATVAMFLASSMKREKRAVAILAIGVAMNVALNLAAIPRYGALGAAWVTVGSQSVIALWLTVDAYRAVALRPGLDLDHERQLEAEIELGHG
jgi:O-antigen/teichoic acid export membrane protein